MSLDNLVETIRSNWWILGLLGYVCIYTLVKNAAEWVFGYKGERFVNQTLGLPFKLTSWPYTSRQHRLFREKFGLTDLSEKNREFIQRLLDAHMLTQCLITCDSFLHQEQVRHATPRDPKAIAEADRSVAHWKKAFQQDRDLIRFVGFKAPETWNDNEVINNMAILTNKRGRR